ncbi:MAG: hypothetical protein COW93_01540, partial [Parcubacteria group bacterium CG22_combo_CG10-13_8_21_14_all_41_9]
SALQDLFATLADEIRENAKEDEIKDRYNLAYALNEAAGMLYLAAEEMSFAASMQPSSAKEAAMT